MIPKEVLKLSSRWVGTGFYWAVLSAGCAPTPDPIPEPPIAFGATYQAAMLIELRDGSPESIEALGPEVKLLEWVEDSDDPCSPPDVTASGQGWPGTCRALLFYREPLAELGLVPGPIGLASGRTPRRPGSGPIPFPDRVFIFDRFRRAWVEWASPRPPSFVMDLARQTTLPNCADFRGAETCILHSDRQMVTQAMFTAPLEGGYLVASKSWEGARRFRDALPLCEGLTALPFVSWVGAHGDGKSRAWLLAAEGQLYEVRATTTGAGTAELIHSFDREMQALLAPPGGGADSLIAVTKDRSVLCARTAWQKCAADTFGRLLYTQRFGLLDWSSERGATWSGGTFPPFGGGSIAIEALVELDALGPLGGELVAVGYSPQLDAEVILRLDPSVEAPEQAFRWTAVFPRNGATLGLKAHAMGLALFDSNRWVLHTRASGVCSGDHKLRQLFGLVPGSGNDLFVMGTEPERVWPVVEIVRGPSKP